MRTDAHQFQRRVVRFSLNQHQIGFHITVAAIDPLAGQGMIEIAPEQFDIGCKQRDNF